MGMLRNVARLAARNSDRIRKAAEDNADQITGTVGKVTARIDERTGGRHRDKLDKLEKAVESAVTPEEGPGTDHAGDSPGGPEPG
jgi:Cdc6-like AAA superfamily ATPase